VHIFTLGNPKEYNEPGQTDPLSQVDISTSEFRVVGAIDRVYASIFNRKEEVQKNYWAQTPTAATGELCGITITTTPPLVVSHSSTPILEFVPGRMLKASGRLLL